MLSLRRLVQTFEAVHVRQTEIQHDQIGKELVGREKAGSAILAGPDFVSLRSQRAPEDIDDFLVVLNDENAPAHLLLIHHGGNCKQPRIYEG